MGSELTTGQSVDSWTSEFNKSGGVGGLGMIVGPLVDYYEQRKIDRANAASYQRQFGMQMQLAGMASAAGRAYGQAGGIAREVAASTVEQGRLTEAMAIFADEIGKANAANEIRRAAQVDAPLQMQLQQINRQRREKIGEGMAAFAANGVLLESRADSATAMWEQDEEADAVVEKLSVMQQAENEIYNMRVAAQQHLVEGKMAMAGYYAQAAGIYSAASGQYANAAGYYAQGAGQYASAASAALQAQESLRLAGQKKRSKWRTGLQLGMGVAQTVIAAYSAGGGGAA